MRRNLFRFILPYSHSKRPSNKRLFSSTMENTLVMDAIDIIPETLGDFSDIQADDHIVIGNDFGYPALEETSRNPTFPVQGLLYGNASRVFAPFIVSSSSKKINVNFLLTTGSPRTYLRRETFAALNLGNDAKKATVDIHGIRLQVRLSTGNFHNVDLLGQDFLSVCGAALTINYATRTIQLKK